MKLIALVILLFGWSGAFPATAQEADAPEIQHGPGPGSPLPKNSEALPAPNLTGIHERAAYVGEQIKAQAGELLSFLALVALIYAGYHAQFRGLEEFVSNIVRIVIAFALLASFQEWAAYFIEARNELAHSLPIEKGDALTQVGAMIAMVSFGACLMGPAGIGVVLAVMLTALGILIVYSAQILFEALLIAIGPLAIACLAFSRTAGIFSAWLKTWIAALLVPIGWRVGLMLGANMYGPSGQTLLEDSTQLVSGVIYAAISGAIYMGMPFLTVWLVNKTVDATATAMPSPIQLMSSSISAVASQFRAGRGGGSVSTGVTTGISSANSTAILPNGNWSVSSPASPANAATHNLPGAYGDRIRSAHQHHKPS